VVGLEVHNPFYCRYLNGLRYPIIAERAPGMAALQVRRVDVAFRGTRRNPSQNA
jgi:hypothetical protein